MDEVQINLQRSVVWWFLAESFRRQNAPPAPLTPEFAGAAAALGLEAEPLLEALRGAGDLTEAYDELFGHTVRGTCPAYESEYGEPRGIRLGHEIGDLHGFYRAFGLKPARRAAERADHISVECEFFGFLALKEARAATLCDGKEDLCRDAARKFLAHHLGRFGRAFAARTQRQSRVPFYREAAGLLDRAIVQDAERLDVKPGSPELPLREDAGTPDDACISCGVVRDTPR